MDHAEKQTRKMYREADLAHKRWCPPENCSIADTAPWWLWCWTQTACWDVVIFKPLVPVGALSLLPATSFSLGSLLSPRAASLQISWEDGAMMKSHCYAPYLSANLGLFLFRHGFGQQGYLKLHAEFISGCSPSLAHKRKSSKGFSGCFQEAHSREWRMLGLSAGASRGTDDDSSRLMCVYN